MFYMVCKPVELVSGWSWQPKNVSRKTESDYSSTSSTFACIGGGHDSFFVLFQTDFEGILISYIIVLVSMVYGVSTHLL